MIEIILAFLGLVFGSFAGATVWRLRARQITQEKAAGNKVDRRELKSLKPLMGHSFKDDRSRCLHCGHALAWYDLLPLVSWMSTRGRCRYCAARIGWLEPLIELGTGLLFVLLYVCWPQIESAGPMGLFALWLVATVMLVILFVYDLKWFLLPDLVTLPLIALSAVIALLRLVSVSDIQSAGASLLGSVLILAGLYFAIYWYSRYRFGEERTWVGFGDVKLGLALALLLGDWKLAFLTLFLANLIGVLYVLPSLVMKRLTMKTQVPFGPLLIVGFFITLLFGSSIVAWYAGLSFNFAVLL